MNRPAHKCAACKKSFQPAKFRQLYCSHRCRQAAYRKRTTSSSKRSKGKSTTSVLPATCEHCSGSFWAKTRRARFCSTSCRTLYHRALRATIPPAICEVYGLPEEKALDLLETQPLQDIRRLLAAFGYTYVHQERRWKITLSVGQPLNALF